MMKKMLSDRKGVAIELAILMTAVCLAVTTIVLSTALLQYENKVQAQQRMEENIIFEQITEKFSPTMNMDAFKNWVEKEYPGYSAEKQEKTLTIKKDGAPVLTIIWNDGNVITSWKKG